MHYSKYSLREFLDGHLEIFAGCRKVFSFKAEDRQYAEQTFNRLRAIETLLREIDKVVDGDPVPA